MWRDQNLHLNWLRKSREMKTKHLETEARKIYPMGYEKYKEEKLDLILLIKSQVQGKIFPFPREYELVHELGLILYIYPLIFFSFSLRASISTCIRLKLMTQSYLLIITWIHLYNHIWVNNTIFVPLSIVSGWKAIAEVNQP